MKKIKLLIPTITALSLTAGITPVIASCSKGETICVIHFEPGEGATEVEDVKVVSGQYVPEPFVLKPGYELAGWFKDEKLTNIFDFQTEKVTSNLTLYAKWTKCAGEVTEDEWNKAFTYLSDVQHQDLLYYSNGTININHFEKNATTNKWDTKEIDVWSNITFNGQMQRFDQVSYMVDSGELDTATAVSEYWKNFYFQAFAVTAGQSEPEYTFNVTSNPLLVDMMSMITSAGNGKMSEYIRAGSSYVKLVKDSTTGEYTTVARLSFNEDKKLQYLYYYNWEIEQSGKLANEYEFDLDFTYGSKQIPVPQGWDDAKNGSAFDFGDGVEVEATIPENIESGIILTLTAQNEKQYKNRIKFFDRSSPMEFVAGNVVYCLDGTYHAVTQNMWADGVLTLPSALTKGQKLSIIVNETKSKSVTVDILQ